MKDYSREIRKLIKRIPTDFECEPGCHECCNLHGWTWTEWVKVPMELRRHAAFRSQPCPFITADGCECYEYRPLICRLYGNVTSDLGPYGRLESVDLSCKIGIEPKTRLSRKEGRAIFLSLMDLLNKEGVDAMNEGMGPLYAGPYGRWIGDRRDFMTDTNRKAG